MTLTAEVFPKLRSPKNKVRSMSIKSRFKGSFKKQHGKRAQTLLKFAWQNLYHIYWSLWRQLNCKKSLLVRWKISRLFPNSLSADGKYSVFNRDNLSQPIQMQVSQKIKKFSEVFSWVLKSSLNFEHFQKKDDSHSWGISEITDSEKHGYIKSKKYRFKGSFGKQHGKRAQTLLKFAWQQLYRFIDCCEGNWHAKSVC